MLYNIEKQIIFNVIFIQITFILVFLNSLIYCEICIIVYIFVFMINEDKYIEYMIVKKPILYFVKGDVIFSDTIFPITSLLWMYIIKGNIILRIVIYTIILALSCIGIVLDLFYFVLKPTFLFLIIPFFLFLIKSIKDIINNIINKAIELIFIVLKQAGIVIGIFIALFSIYVLFDTGKWRVLKDFISNLF